MPEAILAPDNYFWSHVNKTRDGCWLWTGRFHSRKTGYGALMRKGRRCYVHRLSWELTNGPISQGLFVCHHCDNPPCVNPDHLFLGTAKDNCHDMWRKGRHRSGKGEQATFVKLSAVQVLEIRAKYAGRPTESRYVRTNSTRELARLYDVSQAAIWCIVNGRRWTHLSESGVSA